MQYKDIEQEFINRYKYLYINAKYILAPFIYKETREEKDRFIRRISEFNSRLALSTDDGLSVFIRLIDKKVLSDVESFLLSDIPYNESKLYLELEEKKKDSDFLLECKNNLELLSRENNNIIPNLTKLLKEVKSFIELQSGMLFIRNKKILALEQYQLLDKYKNEDSISYISNNNTWCMVEEKKKRKKKRYNEYQALETSNFINYVSSDAARYDYNGCILTEDQKQDIYLEFHDELPWNLEIECNGSDSKIIKAGNTSPCGNSFYIKEDEIFVNPYDSEHRYYHLCPCCGYMVNIPKEVLTPGVISRIEKRCLDEDYSFERMVKVSHYYSFRDRRIFKQDKIKKLINK